MKNLLLAVSVSTLLLSTQIYAMPSNPGECPKAQTIIDEVVGSNKFDFFSKSLGQGKEEVVYIKNGYFDFWTYYWSFLLGPFEIYGDFYTVDTDEDVADVVIREVQKLSGEPEPVADESRGKWLCIYNIGNGLTAVAENPYTPF